MGSWLGSICDGVNDFVFELGLLICLILCIFDFELLFIRLYVLYYNAGMDVSKDGWFVITLNFVKWMKWLILCLVGLFIFILSFAFLDSWWIVLYVLSDCILLISHVWEIDMEELILYVLLDAQKIRKGKHLWNAFKFVRTKENSSRLKG